MTAARRAVSRIVRCVDPTPWRVGLTVGLLGCFPAIAQLNCDPGVAFYPGGGIESCVLNGHHRIYTPRGEPVDCAHGERLEQHPGGRLRACVIRATGTYDGHMCEAPARVEFAPDGAFVGCARD